MFDRCVELCGSGIGAGAKFGGLSDDDEPSLIGALGVAGAAAGAELLPVGLGAALGAFRLGAAVPAGEVLDAVVLG